MLLKQSQTMTAPRQVSQTPSEQLGLMAEQGVGAQLWDWLCLGTHRPFQ